MKDRIKLGIVGLGVGASGHLPAARIEGFDVVALAARTKSKAEDAAAQAGVPHSYTDFDALLAHPELAAVVIATEPSEHRNMVLKALAAGKHVLVEKPFALNIDEAAEMRDRARADGLTAMFAEAYRYAPARAYVKSLIQNGYLGKLKGISMTFFMGPNERPALTAPRNHWRLGAATGGGLSTGPMSTYFDHFIDWFGPVKAINGRTFGADPAARQADGSPADADDTVVAIFELDNGAWGSIVVSIATPFGPGGRINLLGTEGALEITHSFPVATDAETVSGGRFDDGPGIRPLEIPSEFLIPTHPDDPKAPYLRAYRRLYREFAKGIESGTSPSPNFEDGYQLQYISDALHRSNIDGYWIEIDSN